MLTAKQTRFVQEYLLDLNATQAAIRAGYSAKTAYSIGQENLKKPEIVQAIQEAQSARAARLEITIDDVVRGLKAETEREGEGASHSARVSAWGLIGKHLGMFRDRVEVSGKSGGPIGHAVDIRELTDEELTRIILSGGT